MTQDQDATEYENLEYPLDVAVSAVLAEPLPEEAIERVKARAKGLTTLTASTPVVSLARNRQMERRRIIQWTCLIGGVAAVLALSFFVFPNNTTAIAWAEMVQAVREMPWIHGTTTYTDGQQTKTSEFWVSAEQRSAALKFGEMIQFDDCAKEVMLKYDAKENAIYRLPLEATFGNAPTPAFLERLVDEKSDTRNMFNGERVVKAVRQSVEIRGQKMDEYVIRLEHIGNSALQRTLIIRLDAMTHLPQLWEERYSSGMTAVTHFDFPGTGPSDIYDLGVPQTAKLIDKIPSDDLARIAKTLSADRQRFDDYDAVVVQETEGPPANLIGRPTNLNINRVRRSGGRYRVDQLIMSKPGLTAPPENTDFHAWWKEHRDDFWTVPQLVCDGKVIFYYRMLYGRIVPDKDPNLTVTKTMEIPVRLPTDDPPAAWLNLMPEFCVRPHLWLSDENRRFSVETKPNDGPAESVRVVVVGRKGTWNGELYRYWFNPNQDDVLLKSVSTVFKKDSDEVAYLDVEQYDDFVRSPSGKWFPQTARRSTENGPESSDLKSVTRFYVDFTEKLPDALFQPLPE